MTEALGKGYDTTLPLVPQPLYAPAPRTMLGAGIRKQCSETRRHSTELAITRRHMAQHMAQHPVGSLLLYSTACYSLGNTQIVMFIAEHRPLITSALTERMDERNAVAPRASPKSLKRRPRAENLRRAGFKQTRILGQ